MSQLRISRPGKPTVLVPLEPAYARVQGHGGAALGHATTTFLLNQNRRPTPPLRGDALLKKPRQRTYRARP